MGFVSTTADRSSGDWYDLLGDSRGVASVKPYGEDITLTAGEDIRDTNNYDYNVTALGRSTTIILISTLDVACDVDIFIQPVASPTTSLLIYSEDDVLAATTGVNVYSPNAGGTGAASALETVAALDSKAYRFVVRVTAASNPSSGTLTGYAHCA